MGIEAKTVYGELTTALGPNAPPYHGVTWWTSRFLEEREDASDDPRFARPVSELTDENIEMVRQIINNDSLRSTYDEIIAETSLSHATIERIIHDCLKMKKNDISLDTLSIER